MSGPHVMKSYLNIIFVLACEMATFIKTCSKFCQLLFEMVRSRAIIIKEKTAYNVACFLYKLIWGSKFCQGGVKIS